MSRDVCMHLYFLFHRFMFHGESLEKLKTLILKIMKFKFARISSSSSSSITKMMMMMMMMMMMCEVVNTIVRYVSYLYLRYRSVQTTTGIRYLFF
ncbi:hypothetical protein OAV88_02910 [bacterium]|nr:hypothetical protein [bacterium]